MSIFNDRNVNRVQPTHNAAGYIGNALFYLLLSGLVLAALFFAMSSDPNKSFFSYRWYWVQTGSMEPDLPVGALAVVKVVDPTMLRIGDDATFAIARRGGTDYLTHRIVEIIEIRPASDVDRYPLEEGESVLVEEELLFVTRGIANDKNDPEPRSADTVVGKVIAHIPYVGIPIAALRSNPLLAGGAVLCVALTFVFLRRLKA